MKVRFTRTPCHILLYGCWHLKCGFLWLWGEASPLCWSNYTECPTRYRTRHFFNNFTTNEDITTKFEADLPHCVRNVKEKNVFLFKFRCNIFIGVRIIEEMPDTVASGTPCIIRKYVLPTCIWSEHNYIFSHKIVYWVLNILFCVKIYSCVLTI